MHKKILITISFIILSALLVSGCTPGNGEVQEPDINSLAQTYAAQTLEAQHLVETIVAQTMTAEAPVIVDEPVVVVDTATPLPTATQEPAATQTAQPTLTHTPGLLVPIAEVSVATNCRTGPGKIYDVVSVLGVGKQAEVIGRNASTDYWIIKTPGGSGSCWLWGRYATVKGPVTGLQAYTIPPTPTPSKTTDKVTISVSVPTNCRSGPGKPYEIISILHTGKSVGVIARNADSSFWVVENPGGSGNCWVWGKYATLTGPVSSLPVREHPPIPTSASVTLQVSVDTNCRTGPGKAYEIITIFRIGKKAEVLGRNADKTYWVIQNPAGSGNCWVWGKYASVSGEISNVPVLNPPPTPTPKP